MGVTTLSDKWCSSTCDAAKMAERPTETFTVAFYKPMCDMTESVCNYMVV